MSYPTSPFTLTTPDGRTLQVRAERLADGRWQVEVDGQRFEFEADGQPVGGLEAAIHLTDKWADNGEQVRAPMPGVVVEVLVQVGDTVASGDPLLVLSAMKMENTLSAELEGEVVAVYAHKNQSVQDGDLLMLLSARSAVER